MSRFSVRHGDVSWISLADPEGNEFYVEPTKSLDVGFNTITAPRSRRTEGRGACRVPL